MKATVFFLSIGMFFFVSSCEKNNNNALTGYIQMQENGHTDYYSVVHAYWQVIDTGALAGKYYYINGLQAFTDSENNFTLQFRDNTTPANKFCPAMGLYTDLLAPSTGCSDSGKNCMGFYMQYSFADPLAQYYTTADSISPATQLTLFSCDNSYQQISGTFQGRLLLNTSPGVVSITNGQFNDVVFANQ